MSERKDFMDYKLGYLSLDILFLKAHSFPRAMLSENCLLRETDNVCGQMSQHIFTPNGGYCLFLLNFCHSASVLIPTKGLVKKYRGEGGGGGQSISKCGG